MDACNWKLFNSSKHFGFGDCMLLPAIFSVRFHSRLFKWWKHIWTVERRNNSHDDLSIGTDPDWFVHKHV
nr:unnamed protein product [Haemonchus contortus]